MKAPIPKTKVTPSAGDLIEVQWDARKTRFALFVRNTRTGSAIVRLEKVEPGTLGVYHRTGIFSDHPRTIASYDVLRIVATAERLEQGRREAAEANAELEEERAQNGGMLPSERAMEESRWSPWTCYAKPASKGSTCGYTNTTPTFHTFHKRIEVCADCGCTRKASNDRLKEENSK